MYLFIGYNEDGKRENTGSFGTSFTNWREEAGKWKESFSTSIRTE